MRMRCLSCCVLVFAVGCDAGPKLVPVSGKVTLDGKPLVGATVGFYPQNKPSRELGPLSTGKTDDKGEFSLVTVLKREPGAVVGQHRVSITLLATVNVDEGDAPSKVIRRGAATTVKDKVPPKF